MNKDVGEAPKGAEGVITRGKTAKNRLRRVDTFLLQYAKELLTRTDALYVDLGYGAEPTTTLESAQRFHQVNPQLPVLGVEIDPERVEQAAPYENAITHFKVGGFNIPLEDDQHATVIRAFNVLRQYEVDAVQPAWEQMGQSLAENGLLIEGTSSPYGKNWTANLLRKRNQVLQYEGFLFSTNFHAGFSPELFQPYLTKNFIHQIGSGSAIDRFMADWKQACDRTVSEKTWGLRQWFAASAKQLSHHYPILYQKKLLKRGYLLWLWE